MLGKRWRGEEEREYREELSSLPESKYSHTHQFFLPSLPLLPPLSPPKKLRHLSLVPRDGERVV